MSVDRLPGLVLPLVFLVAAAGVPVMLWRERRRPTSYSRSAEFLEGVRRWRELSAREQEAHDTAVLDAAEAVAARAEPPEPPVALTAELIVEAEYARTIGER